MRVIIDTDPGIDDSVALALAAASPELEIAAVTTTYGNTTVDRATRNTRELLTRLGVSERIPVHPGADRPLLRPLQVAADTHGEEGLGYAEIAHAVLPENEPLEAPHLMLRLAAISDQPLTLICLGPLTNLALALALDRPLLQQQVTEIVLMGGEPDGYGNITPVSEFNFWCDPEAAQMVFRSGIPIRMVGLNVTRRMVLTREAVDLLAGHDMPTLRWWGDMLRFYEEFHRAQSGLEGCIINDPLAVALAMAPEYGTARPMYVEIDRHDGPTRGQSLCDRHGLAGQPENARVYTECRWLDVLHLVNERVFRGALPVGELSRGVAVSLGPDLYQ
ncbi:MAG: nucleoside hydrolase [Armatimonadota bacterium]